MPPRKNTNFDIGGQSFDLSAGDIKALGKLIEEIKKMNHLYDARWAVQQKIYKLEVKQAFSQKLETKNYQQRLVVLTTIVKRMDEFNKKRADEIKNSTIPRTQPPMKHLSGSANKQWAAAMGQSPSEQWEAVMGPSIAKKKPTGAHPAVTGALAGVTAAITLKLIGVLESGIKQSKHIQVIQSTISKSMGLLVDLILLPFLPLIFFGLMGLITAIMAVQPLMKPVSDALTLLTQTLGTPITFALVATGALLALLSGAIIYGMVSLAVEAASLALYKILTTKGVVATLSYIADFIWAPIAGVLGSLYTWLMGLAMAGGSAAILSLVISVSLGALAGSVAVWLLNQLGVFDKISELGESFRDNAPKWFSTLPGPIQVIIDLLSKVFQLLSNVINLIPGMNILTDKKMNEIISQGVYNVDVMKRVREMSGSGSGYAAGTGYFDPTGKVIRGYALGGVVPGSGSQLAVVHGGETITPPGSSQGSITLNFYGYQDDKFIAKVKQVLRTEGSRYSL